jgi:uncharacterized protein (DUF302 family)
MRPGTCFIAIFAAVLAAGASLAEPAPPPPVDSGIIRRPSAYSVDETVARLKADVAAKGIKWFSEIDQSDLGKPVNISLRRSVLVQFGNPPLGLQFLTASPYAGLDWPVRMLVFEDADGHVWTAYTDFAWIARRHHIDSRDAQFKMASEVAASIAKSAAPAGAAP